VKGLLRIIAAYFLSYQIQKSIIFTKHINVFTPSKMTSLLKSKKDLPKKCFQF
jgi:hypothetical protein